MAVEIGVDFKGDWKDFGAALAKKNLQPALQREVKRALARIGKHAQKKVRQEIRKGDFAANAALTIAIKGSSKPLVNDGDLWQGVSVEHRTWNSAFVGYSKKSPELYNLAKTLHDGAIITVTEKMRFMFLALALASDARVTHGVKAPRPMPLRGRALELFETRARWFPLKPETKFISIPARPFMKKVFDDPSLQAKFREEIAAAVQRALRQARRPGGGSKKGPGS